MAGFHTALASHTPETEWGRYPHPVPLIGCRLTDKFAERGFYPSKSADSAKVWLFRTNGAARWLGTKILTQVG
jgi:hypothetical protein